jgi:hypothetical protein
MNDNYTPEAAAEICAIYQRQCVERAPWRTREWWRELRARTDRHPHGGFRLSNEDVRLLGACGVARW